ncbi:MAG TPA: hypothetical protein VM260_03660 [Pirellula sp.]|nr:hypothetical protein [Pirellula sp.]
MGISLARAQINPVLRPINCLVQSCRVDEPGGTSTGAVVAFQLDAGQGALHYGCVIQDSLVNFGTAGYNSNYIAIQTGGGIGTIVERNTCLNAQTGLIFIDQEVNDLVVRWNDFQWVTRGVQHSYSGSVVEQLKRFIFLHNSIGVSGASAAKGISIGATATGYIKGPLIFRHNLVRRLDTGSSGDIGIELDYSPQNIIERNIIDLPSAPIDNAIVVRNCANVKTFANRKLNSTLLPGYKPLEARHTEEWELETENLLML